MPTEVTYYKDGKAIQIPRWCVQKAVLIGDSEQKNDFYTSITRDEKLYNGLQKVLGIIWDAEGKVDVKTTEKREKGRGK